MRRKLIAANWKMHKSLTETETFFHALSQKISTHPKVDIVVAPPFTALAKAAEVLSANPSPIQLAAQNMHFAQSGAYTGEISSTMLKDLGVSYIILGHSERRSLFGETNEIIHQKLTTAHAVGLTPILCIGETLEERDAGKVQEVLQQQLHGSLGKISSENLIQTVIAYEPVWAIGTGRTASPEQAQETHHQVRDILQEMTDEATAEQVRILYGGSVKPENTATLMAQPDIDGALVGGASLDPQSFAEIVRAAGG